MASALTTDMRRLPSDADILAVAQVAGYSQVNLRNVVVGGSVLTYSPTAGGGFELFDGKREDIDIGAKWLLIGNGANQISSVAISGAKLSTAQLNVGNGSGSLGVLSVVGENSIVEIRNGGIQVGYEGAGELNISAGGSVVQVTENWGGNIANFSTGKVNLSGAGSSLVLHGNLGVGWRARGTIVVQDGALLSADAITLSPAPEWGGKGSLRISTGAEVRGDIYVNRGAVFQVQVEKL